MSETSGKKAFGVYVTILAALLSLTAGIYFQIIHGTYGATQRVCYDLPVVALLIGGAAISALLVAFRYFGLASAVVTIGAGSAILFAIHKCYWYISDVFVAIDEKGFDPKFIIFMALATSAFLIGEIAIYTRKVKPVKS